MVDFKQLFESYRTKKIALYGLSVETQRVLPCFEKDFQVIGLVDSFQMQGELYGKVIISMEQVIDRQVEMIVVVARPGSCKAIAKKIGKICQQNHIALFDIRGKNLLEKRRECYHFKGVKGISKQELWSQIMRYEAVSFDLFDTLVMRNTFFSTDVYEIAERRLRRQGVIIENFAERRLQSEKTLAQVGAVTLKEIYQYMLEIDQIVGIDPGMLAEEEWKVDLDLLIPRYEMCSLLSEAYKLGKEIYIVSDTYYTKEQLQCLLKKMGISVTEILASCEYRVSKTQGLYEKLKELLDGRTCIHIGDDEEADVNWAEKAGVCTFKIYSGIELMELTGYMGLWGLMETLPDRIKVGMFAAKIFNSPFQFENVGKSIVVHTAYDIGYLFAAPMILDFVLWFERMIKEWQIPNVWLGARDGYLLEKLFKYLKGEDSCCYLLTSRMVAVRAGMKTAEDIRYVADMQFPGSLQEQLKVRFGICADPQEGNSLSAYCDRILERGLQYRKNYLCYLQKMDIKEGSIAFFDFVAKGTVQMYLERIIERPLKGLYFLQLEEEYMQKYDLDIMTFYTKEEREHSVIFEDYYILETILSSPEPSVEEFDEQGMPVFSKETRTEEEMECILEEQQGIFEYFEKFIKLCPDYSIVENKKLDEKMLDLIHKLNIEENRFWKLKVEDPFFNRNTNMEQMF